MADGISACGRLDADHLERSLGRMNLTSEVRIFRAPRWALAAAMVSAVLFLIVAYLSYRFNGLSWVTVTLLVLIPIGIAGAVDALTQRIDLHHEHIVVVQNLRRRE